MVHLISKDSFFFREIPFTTANAEAIRKGTQRGFALYETGQYVLFLSTDIRNASYSIALVKTETTKPYEENVKKCSSEGIDEDGYKIQLFVPTNVKTYEYFRPTIYQACLIYYKGEAWRLAVCSGYNEKDNQPRFYGYTNTYKSIPFCKETEKLCNEDNISWKEFVAQKIEHEEDKKKRALK